MVCRELGGFSDGQHVHTVHLEQCGVSPARAGEMNTATVSVGSRETPGKRLIYRPIGISHMKVVRNKAMEPRNTVI